MLKQPSGRHTHAAVGRSGKAGGGNEWYSPNFIHQQPHTDSATNHGECVCVSLCVRYWHASAYSYIYRNMITNIYAKLYKLFEISGHICTSAARVCSWCQGDIPRPVTGKIWDLHGLSYTQQLVQCDSPVPEKWGETQLQHSLAGLISILPRSQLDALIHCLCVSIFKESQWPHVYPVFLN